MREETKSNYSPQVRAGMVPNLRVKNHNGQDTNILEGLVYCIKHKNTGVNIDSNGRAIYMAAPKHNNNGNEWQHWGVEITQYRLEATITGFQYGNLEAALANAVRTPHVLSEYHGVIRNPTNASVSSSVSKSFEKVNTITWGFNRSSTLEFSNKFTISTDAKLSIGALNMGGSIIRESEDTISLSLQENQQYTYSYTSADTISHNVNVLPNSSISIDLIINQARDFSVPLAARVKIEGFSDRVKQDGNFVRDTEVDLAAVQNSLELENYQGNFVGTEGNQVIFEVNGALIGDIACESIFDVKDC